MVGLISEAKRSAFEYLVRSGHLSYYQTVRILRHLDRSGSSIVDALSGGTLRHFGAAADSSTQLNRWI